MQKVKEKEKAKSLPRLQRPQHGKHAGMFLVSVQDKEKVKVKVKRAILIPTSSRQSVSRFDQF